MLALLVQSTNTDANAPARVALPLLPSAGREWVLTVSVVDGSKVGAEEEEEGGGGEGYEGVVGLREIRIRVLDSEVRALLSHHA